MAAAFWPASRQTVTDPNGRTIPGARLQLFLSGTTTPLTAFSNPALTTPAPKSGAGNQAAYVADGYGRWPRLYLPYVDYRERVTTAAGVLLWDDDGLANPAPASSGGGSTVPDSQLLKTGSWKWLPYDVEESGWVRANQRTIGSAGSGATERANADTQDLYILLWNRLPDTVCPVSTGRGANAAADYAAGKTLQLPDMRGVSPFGLDDMGNSAASRFLGVTFDIGTATDPGSSGGRNTTTIAQANLPAISPAITVSDTSQKSFTFSGTTVQPGTGSPQTVVTGIFTGPGGGGTTVQTTTTTGGSVTAAFSVPLGSGTAASTMPRFMLGSHFLKL